MSSSLFSKIKYRKERVGFVEKGGKTYAKYTKVPRFPISKNVKYVVFCVFILAVLGLGFKLLLSEMASQAPAEEKVG